MGRMPDEWSAPETQKKADPKSNWNFGVMGVHAQKRHRNSNAQPIHAKTQPWDNVAGAPRRLSLPEDE